MLRAITHNWSWKLASLGLSVLLWYTVASDEVVLIAISVPIHYRNLPGTLELASDIPATVRVEITGTSRRLTSASLSGVVASVDLSGIQGAGMRAVNLSTANIRLPAGVSLNRVIPSQIRLSVDRKIMRTIPVKPVLQGTLPEGLALDAFEPQPGVVRVVGPELIVRQLRFAETAPIDLAQIRESGSVPAPLMLQDAQVRLADRPSVSVKLTLRSGAVGKQ